MKTTRSTEVENACLDKSFTSLKNKKITQIWSYVMYALSLNN